jgi:hypothetical protein
MENVVLCGWHEFVLETPPAMYDGFGDYGGCEILTGRRKKNENLLCHPFD